MPDLPTVAAARLPRARWLDARFLLGVVLVFVSVVVGAKVVAEADDTIAVWGTSRALGPGGRLDEDDLVRRRVLLDGDRSRYIRADAEPPVGYVLTRPVGAGELLPVDAVARSVDAPLRRLPVEVDRVSTTGLVSGAVVDVYVVPDARVGAAPAGSSELVVGGVTVDEVEQRSAGFGSGSPRGGGVVLLVVPADARKVLDAQVRGTLRLLHVPTGRPAGGRAS